MTFGVLLWAFHAGPELFRTGWFVESLMTQLAIVLVIRTYRPFYRSKPGRLLWMSITAMTVIAVLLPYLPGLAVFGFVPLPAPLLAVLVMITLLYVAASELGKRIVYRAPVPQASA